MTTTMTRKTKVFRSGGVRFAGWAWIVFAILNLADLAWRGRDMESLAAAAVMLLGSGIAYVTAIRPRIVADEESVRFHNLLRDVHLPWESVRRFEGGDAVYAHVDDGRHRAYVLQSSPRARAKSEMRARREEKKLPEAVADYMRGRTATDFTVEQLREMAARDRQEPEGTREVIVRWSWPAILACVVPGVLAVVTIVVASV